MPAYTLPFTSRHMGMACVFLAGFVSHTLLAVEEKCSTNVEVSESASKTNDSKALPTAKDVRGASAMVTLTEEVPAKIFIDPPIPNVLARGMVLMQFRTENLRLLPVLGSTALNVSPRIGHLHIRLDDSPWVWAHTNGDDLIINRLSAGSHKIQFELVNANHQVLEKRLVLVDVPQGRHTASFPTEHESSPDLNSKDQRPAKLIVDSPQSDGLKHGVAFIQFRTENA